MLSEFDLIARYFKRPVRNPQSTLGVGDDCALLKVAPGMELAVSTDMLVQGRHFFPDVDPHALGHKSLAVNLSDLAAMGARPLAFTLALALPAPDPDWLSGFAAGLFGLADAFQCDLVGGDTTRGPLTICITVFGEVPSGMAPRRSGARAGDDIWISGALGDARLALAALNKELTLTDAMMSVATRRLHQPQPRVALGLALRGMATSCIDISDGLSGDLGHILAASDTGATVDLDALPAGAALQQQGTTLRREFAFNGGDDYELCFTASPQHRDRVLQAAQVSGVPVARVGQMEAEPGLRLIDSKGGPVTLLQRSFDHFHT